MGMKPENIELHIEELMLRGFSPADRYRIGHAIERELARMFAEQGTPPSLVQGHEVAHLNGETFRMKPGSKAETIGVQVAQAVYGGLGA